MKRAAWIFNLLIVTAIFLAGTPVFAQSTEVGDGEGVDSQLLWPTPGPSNFATLQSSDIVAHKGVAFGAVFGHYRRPLGLEVTVDGKTEDRWIVEYATTTDFLWAYGLFDIFQVGLALPVVLDQSGIGATQFMPAGADESSYKLAGSALRDLRIDLKNSLEPEQSILAGRFPGPKVHVQQHDVVVALTEQSWDFLWVLTG